MNSNSSLLRKPGNRPRVGTLIRNLRRRQDQTLQELGDQAGLSVGFLSQVEREIATPSLSALAQIAQALGVDIEYFVASPSSDSTCTRSGERETYWVDSAAMTYERVSADFPGSTLSAFLITLPPGFTSEVTSHDGEEVVLQMEGRSRFDIEGEIFDLKVGDSLHFRSSRNHSWSNPTGTASKISWTGTAHILRRKFKPFLAKV